jgi:signal transduction histidine kinase
VTFRTRLLLAAMTTLAVGLGALLVLGNVLLAQRTRAEITSVMRANADSQISALIVTPTSVRVRETANDDVLDRRSWVFDGDRVIERPPGASPELDRIATRLGRTRKTTEEEGPDDVRLRSEPVRAEGIDEPVGAVVVSYSTESVERLQREVLVGSVVLAALVMLAGALAIRSALNGALRPVAQMTDSAREWGAHDLDRRFELGPARDELTSLAATLDGLLARIAASRRHEQRFASEVAHELRTPLAALQLRAELALSHRDDDADDDERDEALRAIVADAGRLGEAIDALLAMARHEIDPSIGSVDLAALARELESVEVTAPADLPMAEGDPDIVRRALMPLVDNARRHARTAVRVELEADERRLRLTVLDDGPGVDSDLGDRVFDPGVRGDDNHPGAGLGLPLARRLARSCGGDVRLGQGPGGRFVLELPALRGPGLPEQEQPLARPAEA